MPLEIIHTADTHLGYQQYHSETRNNDFRDAFQTVISDAIEQDVDAVIHAGDLFHHKHPSIGTLSDAVKELKRLQQEEIPFYLILGNHETTRDQTWPEFLEELELAQYIGYTGHDIEFVTIYGQDYVDPVKRPQLSYDFHQSDNDINLLVAHGLFEPFDYANWDTSRLITKAPMTFDCILLGDNHTPQQDTIDDIPITYAGSTERTGADQRLPRGYNFIQITENGDISITRKTIETRPFVYIDIEMDENDSTGDVVRQVRKHNIPDNSVVIVTLDGCGGRITSGEVEEQGLEKGALTVQVNDRREFDDEKITKRDVSFGDVEEAIENERHKLPIGELAHDLEKMIRDNTVSKSEIDNMAQKKVEDAIESGEIEEKVTNVSVKNNSNEDVETSMEDEDNEQEKNDNKAKESNNNDGNKNAIEKSTSNESNTQQPTSTPSEQASLDDIL